MGKKLTNRQLAAQETKRKLMAAAKKLVSEKGLANTSIEEITNACGVANGTFYTYFKRKEDVLYALSREIYQEIYDQALAYEGTFLDRLVYFMISFSGYIEEGSLKLCQEWVRTMVDPDDLESPEDSKLLMDLDSVRGLIESGRSRGELKPDVPVELLAHTLVDVLYGQMLCWDMSGGAYSFRERTREFCDEFLEPIVGPYLVS